MKRTRGQSPSLLRAVGLGLMAAVIWTIIGAMLVAKLVDREVAAMESVGYFSMGILILGGYLAGRVAAAALRKADGPIALWSAGACILTLMGCNLLFFGGDFRGMGLCALLILLGSLLNLIPLRKAGGGKRRVHYKIPR